MLVNQVLPVAASGAQRVLHEANGVTVALDAAPVTGGFEARGWAVLATGVTQHGGITLHVADLLWVAHRRPSEGSVLRTALCGVVVGNRPPPSQVVARRP